MSDKTPQGGLGQSWFVLDYQATYGEAPKLTGGNTPSGLFGPALVSTEETFVFAGAVELRRPAPVLEPVAVALAIPGILELQRRRTFAYSGSREPATRIVMARRDDDELLLLL